MIRAKGNNLFRSSQQLIDDEMISQKCTLRIPNLAVLFYVKI